MKSSFICGLAIFYLFTSIYGQSVPKEPVTGHWNVTNAIGKGLCIKMDAAFSLAIVYKTMNDSKTATIVSDASVVVSQDSSWCKNSSIDLNETLALHFGDRSLTFQFTRDQTITGDKTQQKWLLYQIQFDFIYDNATFPNAIESGKNGSFVNETPLKEISGTHARSYGCSKVKPQKVTQDFEITLTNFRAQPFITGDDFDKADWCVGDQSSDLIPIIIGAALAALVIIVLIAYLIGRARAKSTNYDNI